MPGGAFALGARPTGFAYDNERPRHTVETPAFHIARHPIANAAFLRFVEDGGYERREWWSRGGLGVEGRSGDHAPARLGARGAGARGACSMPSASSGNGRRASSGATPASARTRTGEYSEVFFGHGYRVLRGGSWAASPRVATRTFRNWDAPQRRQVFSGIRLVMEI